MADPIASRPLHMQSNLRTNWEPVSFDNPIPISSARTPGAVAVYRDSVNTPLTAADTLAVPSISTSIPVGVGSLTNANHGVQVVAGNQYGTTTAAAVTTQATGASSAIIRITFSQVSGATFYDIYLSTSTTAPLYVGRVTEAQRAAGCTITAAASATANATIGAGGVAGAVDVYVVGAVSGRTTSVDCTFNRAYTPDSIAEIDCSGYSTLEVYPAYSRVAASAAALLALQLWIEGAADTWHMLEERNVPITGIAPNKDAIRFDVRGLSAVKILVGAISGPGATVSLHTRLLA